MIACIHCRGLIIAPGKTDAHGRAICLCDAPKERYALQFAVSGAVMTYPLFESRESAERYAAPHADRLRVVPILIGEKNV